MDKYSGLIRFAAGVVITFAVIVGAQQLGVDVKQFFDVFNQVNQVTQEVPVGE